MTYDEAIEVFGNTKYINLTYRQFRAMTMLIDAAELQVPKKPIKEKCDLSKCSDVTVELSIDSYNCPNCGGCLADELDMKLHSNCKHCGQKLDWSEE